MPILNPNMAPQSKRNVMTAEAALVQLRSCLVNLPPSVVTVLVNADTVRFYRDRKCKNLANRAKAAQNVVIEIQYQAPTSSTNQHHLKGSDQSFYVGWTGLPSQQGSRALGRRNGSKGSSIREQDSGVVEIDSTFARMIGLVEGQKVAFLPLIWSIKAKSKS